MQSKGLLSLIMVVAIGTVRVSASHSIDLDGTNAMEELALVMDAAQEFTAKAMGGASPCIKKEGWSSDLTLQILDEMMKTFLGVRWGMTYLFAPQCPNLRTRGHVFVSGSGNHAEDNMAAQCGLPTEFYLTSAPCPDCAMMLYNKYKAKDYKPLIHIAHPYQGRGKPGSKRVNLHCLAMLMGAGFTIVPWSWINFEHDYITDANCTETINEMTNDSDSLYNMRYSMAMTTIQRAMDVMAWGHDHNYKICKDAASTVNNERYTIINERNPVNLVDNERYTANNKRYAAKNERYVANNVNNERYTAKGERYTANNERYTANNERSPASDERYAASNYVDYARYTAKR